MYLFINKNTEVKTDSTSLSMWEGGRTLLVHFCVIYFVTKRSVTCSPLFPVIMNSLPFVYFTRNTDWVVEWNSRKGPVSCPSPLDLLRPPK